MLVGLHHLLRILVDFWVVSKGPLAFQLCLLPAPVDYLIVLMPLRKQPFLHSSIAVLHAFDDFLPFQFNLVPFFLFFASLFFFFNRLLGLTALVINCCEIIKPVVNC